MFDNPLYGAMGKAHARPKDQDHFPVPDSILAATKPAESEAERPPVPTPRNRSFTCSEGKAQPSAPAAAHPVAQKKPVVPSRSEGGMGPNRPPLPSKFRGGVPEAQPPKPRDYRDSSELPLKHRLPAPRPQQNPKDCKQLLLQTPSHTHVLPPTVQEYACLGQEESLNYSSYSRIR